MTTKTVLEVHGMSCPSCVSHVRKSLTMPGVSKVEIRFLDGVVAVEHVAQVRADHLIAALAAAGYHAKARAA